LRGERLKQFHVDVQIHVSVRNNHSCRVW
jgi:hypothetical protein